MKKDNLAIEYGTYAGLSLIIFMAVIHFAGLSTNKLIGMFSYIILLAFLFISIKKAREVKYEGLMSFGQGYGSGFKTGVFAAILVAVYTFVFYEFIDPDALNQILEISEQEMYKNKSLTEEQIETALEMSSKFIQPLPMMITTLFSFVIITAILALVPAAILKSK